MSGAPYNEPAFPQGPGVDEVFHSGMTLRDCFAAIALCGLCAGTPGPHLAPRSAARLAFEYADAMLLQRLEPQ